MIATEQAVKTSFATKTQANASATLSNQPLVGSVTSVSPATGTSPTASSANAMGTPTPATHRLVSATTVGMQLWATSVTNVSLATTEDQRLDLIKFSAESASVQTQRPAGTTLPGRELVSLTQPPYRQSATARTGMPGTNVTSAWTTSLAIPRCQLVTVSAVTVHRTGLSLTRATVTHTLENV